MGSDLSRLVKSGSGVLLRFPAMLSVLCPTTHKMCTCVYMCVYVCTYVCVRACVRVCVCVSERVGVYMCMRVCMYACMCMEVYINKCI